MALIDNIRNIATEEGGQSFTEDMPGLENAFDTALVNLESGISVSSHIDYDVAQIMLLIRQPGTIKDKLDKMFKEIELRYKVSSEKLKPIKNKIDTWIISNKTRISVLEAIPWLTR